jgi:hypothetical protein
MKKSKTSSKEGKGGPSPSQLIDARIKELGDWRGETLARLRMLIKEADPKWSRSGSGEGFRCGRTPGADHQITAISGKGHILQPGRVLS